MWSERGEVSFRFIFFFFLPYHLNRLRRRRLGPRSVRRQRLLEAVALLCPGRLPSCRGHRRCRAALPSRVHTRHVAAGGRRREGGGCSLAGRCCALRRVNRRSSGRRVGRIGVGHKQHGMLAARPVAVVLVPHLRVRERRHGAQHVCAEPGFVGDEAAAEEDTVATHALLRRGERRQRCHLRRCRRCGGGGGHGLRRSAGSRQYHVVQHIGWPLKQMMDTCVGGAGVEGS